MKKLPVLLFLLVVAVAVPAAAATLTFPDNICSANSDGSGAMIACINYSYVNQAYGDTASLDVQYVDNVLTGNTLRWWSTGYNNLPNAVWGGTGDCSGCSNDSILLIPATGYAVTLNGFDLGAWPNNVLNTHVIITEVGTGNILADYGLKTIGTGNVAVHFAPGVTSSLGIDIQWYDSGYDVGIDNIDYSITPEPATISMIGFGVVALAGRVRKLLR